MLGGTYFRAFAFISPLTIHAYVQDLNCQGGVYLFRLECVWESVQEGNLSYKYSKESKKKLGNGLQNRFLCVIILIRDGTKLC